MRLKREIVTLNVSIISVALKSRRRLVTAPFGRALFGPGAVLSRAHLSRAILSRRYFVARSFVARAFGGRDFLVEPAPVIEQKERLIW